MKQFVIYTRVSTKEQGKSGLGLAAQERDIQIYLSNYVSEPYEVIGRFCDVESGTKADRPELSQAVAMAKKQRAVLLVAKLDRLSRKVSQIAALMDEEAKLELRVASMPSAPKFQLHLYAALAEVERDFISARTKAALASAKERGVKLGGRRAEAQPYYDSVAASADAFAQSVREIILGARNEGKSYRQIAELLNCEGVKTAQGGQWQSAQVLRYERRLTA